MKRRLIAAATACLTVFGSPVFAEVHVVQILNEGYFPDITYLNSADTIRFVNSNPNYPARVRRFYDDNSHDNDSNGNTDYITPDIAVGGYYEMTVTAFLAVNDDKLKMRPPRYKTGSSSYGKYYSNSDQYIAEISFNIAPNG